MIQRNNIKTFLIGILLGLIIGVSFIFTYMEKKINLTNDKNKDLENNIKNIENERNSLNGIIQNSYILIEKFKIERDSLDSLIAINDIKIKKSSDYIIKNKAEREDIKKKIETIENTKNNKNGEELILSIKNKIK